MHVLVPIAVVLAAVVAVFLALRRRIANGNRQSIRRGLLAASATAVCIFVVVYWSAWSGPRSFVSVGSDKAQSLRMTSTRIRALLDEYAEKNGRYPNSLQEALPQYMTWVDPWGNPFQYVKTDSGYRLFSLGRDGKPGGIGLDGDFELTRGYEIPITLHQFLFEGEGSGGLFEIALSASVCAWLACFLLAVPRRQPNVVSWSRSLVCGLVTIVATLFTIMNLVLIYSFGSGH